MKKLYFLAIVCAMCSCTGKQASPAESSKNDTIAADTVKSEVIDETTGLYQGEPAEFPVADENESAIVKDLNRYYDALFCGNVSVACEYLFPELKSRLKQAYSDSSDKELDGIIEDQLRSMGQMSLSNMQAVEGFESVRVSVNNMEKIKEKGKNLMYEVSFSFVLHCQTAKGPKDLYQKSRTCAVSTDGGSHWFFIEPSPGINDLVKGYF